VSSSGAAFYPYTIVDGERPDNIAANYYEDPRYSWLVYFSNNIIDPYYDWPLTTKEFDSFINSKYGTKKSASEKIVFWRDNWRDDDTIKSIAGYEALTKNLKKYFTPISGYNNNVTGYVRAESNRVVETNKIIELTLSSTSGFAINNIVTQYTSGVLSGRAEVVAVPSNTMLIIKNVIGSFTATAGNAGNLISTSSASSAITSLYTTIDSIPVDEFAYWTPIDALSYETEINDSKRSIKLIDRAYIDQIEKELNELL
jgi:hypothetical protein